MLICVHEQVAKRIANVRFTADKHSPLTVNLVKFDCQ